MAAPAINYNGPDWTLFEQYLGDALLDTYQRLANVEISPAETDQLRGRAQFIGLLLDLKNQQPQDILTL